jgi:3,4-dihydroxy 2-butanone 4-phosphate synthase/GTP cyclohydrolase II
MKAYKLQEEGYDTVEANLALGFAADERTYDVGADILRDLGVRSVRLLTNNPDKVEGLEEHGVEVVERVPLVIPANPTNKRYLRVKSEKMGHLLDVASNQ